MTTSTHSDDAPGAGAHDPTIVVGYDGSDTAKAAVAYARRRAGAAGRVFVVQAYELPPDLLGFPNYDQLLQERQRHGRALLDGLATQTEGDPRIETELIGGPPAQAIADVAGARHADEIVVGARGLSRARAALLGSVSSELLHRADRPVVVIPAAALGGAHAS
jgi:nucleotide-binding universal stress UspA family protein